MRKSSLLDAPFNWREVPFVRLLVPLMIGIACQFQFEVVIPYLRPLLLVLFLFIGFFAFRKIEFQNRMWYGLLLNAALLILGFQLAQQYDERHDLEHFSTYLKETTTLLIQVNDIPVQTEHRLKFPAKVLQVAADSIELTPVSGNLMVYLPLDSSDLQISYGQKIFIHGSIRPIPSPRNPEAFDFQRYMHFQNIHYQYFGKTAFYEVLDLEPSFSLFQFTLQLRKRALGIIDQYISTPDEKAIAQALILGYKANLSDRVKENYAGTGAIHVLAVSGLHVGLIAFFLHFILGQIRLYGAKWRMTKTGITLMGIWLFALLTGAGPSVLRAATMFSIIIIGTSISRYTSIYNSLAASAFLLLIINPYLLAQVGFQLSYLAVLGIVYFQPRLYKMLYIQPKVPDYLWTLVSVGLAAQLTTFPLSVYYFHQFPVYFWLSGLVVVPMAGIILGLGFFLLLFSWIPLLNQFLGWVLWACIWVMNFSIETIRHFPFSLWEGIWVNGWEVWLLYAALLFLALGLSWRKTIFFILAISCLVLSASSATYRKVLQQTQREIVIYDVYQQTVIDLIHGQQVYSVYQDPLDEKRIQYAAETYRWSKGIQSQQYLPLQDTIVETASIYMHRHLIQFEDQRVAFFQELESPPDQPFQCDLLIVHHTKRFDPETVDQFYAPEQIIFDGSIPSWKVEKWRLACIHKGYRVHVTSMDGAYVVELD